jgi:hypothetical protein
MIPPAIFSFIHAHYLLFWVLISISTPVTSSDIMNEYTSETYNPAHSFSSLMHTAKCFSCMSKFYEAVWPALAHVYKPPMNFTDRCNDDTLDPRSVPTTHCPTICVSMWEEPIVAGVKIRGHIRGCLDDLLHNGFNQSIIVKYRWMNRDSCREYRKRELFKLPHSQSDESSINVCICYADHCNATANARQNSALSLSFLMPFAIVMLSFIRAISSDLLFRR